MRGGSVSCASVDAQWRHHLFSPPQRDGNERAGRRLDTALMLKTPLAMAGALCALLVSAPLAVAASPATLAVIGDTPYGQPQIDQFPGDVAEINADPAVSRVIHLADIKNGSSRCDTSYFRLVRSDFDGFADPLVYTPGDNEWTDCYRANNGGYQPAGPTPAGARAGRAGRPRAHFFYPPPPT